MLNIAIATIAAHLKGERLHVVNPDAFAHRSGRLSPVCPSPAPMRERLALHTWTLDSTPLAGRAPGRAGGGVAGRRAPADRLRAGRRGGPAGRRGAGPRPRERPRRRVRRRPARLDVRRRRGAGAAPRGDDRVLPVGAGARRPDRHEPRRPGDGRPRPRGGRPSARWGTSAPPTGSGSRSRRRRRPPSSTRSSGSASCSRGRATASCGLLRRRLPPPPRRRRPPRRGGPRAGRDRLRPVQRRAGIGAPARPDRSTASRRAGASSRSASSSGSSRTRATPATAPTRRRIPPPGRAIP